MINFNTKSTKGKEFMDKINSLPIMNGDPGFIMTQKYYDYLFYLPQANFTMYFNDEKLEKSIGIVKEKVFRSNSYFIEDLFPNDKEMNDFYDDLLNVQNHIDLYRKIMGIESKKSKINEMFETKDL